LEKRVGLWIDLNKAVIVSIHNNLEHTRIITPDMDQYFQYPTVVTGNGSSAYIRDSHFWSHLDAYYNSIIEYIHGATEIQIFGPEGAKYELQKRLESKGLAGHIVSLEDTHKLTDHQIATRILQRFPIRSRFSISPDRK
jgi:hypothetical protein